MTDTTQKELGQEFVRKLNNLALEAEKVRGSGAIMSDRHQFYRRRLAKYFMGVNYTVVLERINRGEYPDSFLQEKLKQMDDLMSNSAALERALTDGAQAESTFDLGSFNRS